MPQKIANSKTPKNLPFMAPQYTCGACTVQCVLPGVSLCVVGVAASVRGAFRDSRLSEPGLHRHQWGANSFAKNVQASRQRLRLSGGSVSLARVNLAGKIALVTGAARRIGREIALGLARRGAHVVVHYNSSVAEARSAVAQIKRLGVDAVAVRANQASSRQVCAAVARALKHFGRIDVLVNSAAVYEKTPWNTLSERDWDYHIDANLKGPFLFALEVGRHMKRRGGPGKIINFADWAGIRPYANYLPYCVSKAGVICLTKSLANALGPAVQVNAVAPGPVLLPEDCTEADKRAIITATVVKRLGSPQDVVNAVIFLIEGSDFITGHTLVVDGGRLIAGA
jgi:pteridine reductase